MPALLCAKSSLPKRSTTRATSASLSGAEATSQAKNSACPPAASIALTVSSPPAREVSRSATITAAPSWPKRIAQARPMPLAAPVTSPALPSIRPGMRGNVPDGCRIAARWTADSRAATSGPG